jgi:hypothetical protein
VVLKGGVLENKREKKDETRECFLERNKTFGIKPNSILV